MFQASRSSHKTAVSSPPAPHSNISTSERPRLLSKPPQPSTPSVTLQASPNRPPFTRACDEESETDIEESQDLLASPSAAFTRDTTSCLPHSSESPPRALSCSYAASEESFDNETVCVEDYLQSLSRGSAYVPPPEIAQVCSREVK